MGKRTAAALLFSCMAGCATMAPSDPARGYLGPGAFDLLAVLPRAPIEGDPRAEADRAIFRGTRQAAGSPRWALATNDVELTPAAMMQDFSCAAGIVLTPRNAPRTLALVRRASVDAVAQTNRAKDMNRRRRPFLIDQGPTCQPQSQLNSFDYPSGHTTYGWTWATLLAWAEPDRATSLLARGRAYGESRAICGVHNSSAVEAGRLSATATLDAMAGLPEFQHDLKRVRRELAGLRRSGPAPAPAACAAEAALVAEKPY